MFCGFGGGGGGDGGAACLVLDLDPQGMDASLAFIAHVPEHRPAAECDSDGEGVKHS